MAKDAGNNRFTIIGILISFVLLSSYSCSTEDRIVVPFSHPYLDYSGRIDSTRLNGVTFYWSGTSVRIEFEGESISAIMKEERGDNYYNVILDGDSLTLLRPTTRKKAHELASNLSPGRHSLELFKRTEWDRGKSFFYGFEIGGEAKIHPDSEPKKRKIEFYGNSITAGYAVEDLSGEDSPAGTYTNHALSYATLTARHFDAEFHTICKSGIGITVGYFHQVMPEIYDRIDPTNARSKWDFKKFVPDVVVINLFQNDNSIVLEPDHAQYKARFGSVAPSDLFIVNSYADFVRSMRSTYPDAHIIGMLGNMDAVEHGRPWPSYVKQAVALVNDPKVYAYIAPFKGTPDHPSVSEQEALANGLIEFIEENIEW